MREMTELKRPDDANKVNVTEWQNKRTETPYILEIVIIRGTASDYGKHLLIINRVPDQDEILYHTSTFGYDIPLDGDRDYALVLKFCEVYFTQPNKIAKDFRDLKLSLFSIFIGVEISRGLLVPLDVRVYSHYPSPSLMIVKDIHNLCPKHETAEVAKRLGIAFLNMLDPLKTKREAQKCFVLATTSQIELLSLNIRRCGRLDCELEIPVSSTSGRAEILKCLSRKLENHKVAWKDVE
uniref:Uncharacterized protein n=1 Tax=Glossina brevipalpis TaxID=37001 RepID=A0A1A9WKL4_9MUSC